MWKPILIGCTNKVDWLIDLKSVTTNNEYVKDKDKHANALGKQYLRASCSKDKLASYADLLLAYHAILPQQMTGGNVWWSPKNVCVGGYKPEFKFFSSAT